MEAPTHSKMSRSESGCWQGWVLASQSGQCTGEDWPPVVSARLVAGQHLRQDFDSSLAARRPGSGKARASACAANTSQWCRAAT